MTNRWNGTIIAVVLGVALGCGIGGCSTTTTSTDPQQSAIDFTYKSYASLDAAIVAADTAVKAGTLKGAAARNTLAAMTTAKTGLDAALASLKASAAASAPK